MLLLRKSYLGLGMMMGMMAQTQSVCPECGGEGSSISSKGGRWPAAWSSAASAWCSRRSCPWSAAENGSPIGQTGTEVERMDTKWKKGLLLLSGIALTVAFSSVIGRLALLLLVSATITALLLFGLPALSRQAQLLGQTAPQLMESYQNTLSSLSEKLSRLGVPQEALASLEARAAGLLGKGAEFLAGRLMLVISAVTERGYLIFSPVLAFYLLKDRKRLFSRLTQLIPSRIRRPVLQVGLAVQEALTAYARGQMAVSAVTGALTALGLLCIGVPGWLFLGAAMALCNLIPYFGPWLGALPVVLFCGGMGLKKIALGLLIVFAAQQIEGLFVSPLVIGDAARLHPGLVILSLIAGGWAAGLPGMFYALPAVLSLRATLSALLRARLQR